MAEANIKVNLDYEKCPLIPESHTVKEWAEMPDKVSVKNRWYVYSDYRTDNDIDVARFKFGDGKTMISKLPFVTAAITDNDMEFWDDKVDGANDFGNKIAIDQNHGSLVFPSDGYLMLTFTGQNEQAIVNIYGASGKSFFTFSKQTNYDYQSKEVFVRKGMKCMFVSATPGAKVEFIPLI